MPVTLEREDIRAFVEEPLPIGSTQLTRLDPFEFRTENPSASPIFEGQAEQVDFDLVVEIRARSRRVRLLMHAENRYRDGNAVLVVARTDDGLVDFRFSVDKT